MLVREIMTTEVTTLQESDAALEAALIFARSSIRHLPVLRDKMLVGVVTERDVKRFSPGLLSGVSSEQYQSVMESTPLSKVMTRDPLTLRPDQDVSEATNLFITKRFGCLPVVENDNLVGIVTTSDLLRLMAKMMKGESANH
jgi:CBS domain-containing protein